MSARHGPLRVVLDAEQIAAPARLKGFVRLTGLAKEEPTRLHEGSPCWVWIGSHSRKLPMACMHEPADGKARNMNARRAMWIAITDAPLTRTALVLPACGFLSCVNPAHLVKVAQ